MLIIDQILDVVQTDLVDMFTTQRGLVDLTVGYFLIKRVIFPAIFKLAKAIFMWLFVRSEREIEILLHHKRKAAVATLQDAQQTIQEVDWELSHIKSE